MKSGELLLVDAELRGASAHEHRAAGSLRNRVYAERNADRASDPQNVARESRLAVVGGKQAVVQQVHAEHSVRVAADRVDDHAAAALAVSGCATHCTTRSGCGKSRQTLARLTDALADTDWALRLRAAPRLRFAGQITGVEGYVESAAMGLVAGRYAAAERLGEALTPPPPTTPMGVSAASISGNRSSALA